MTDPGPGDGAGRVTWLGHATVLVETPRLRLLTDPVLRSRVMHLRRHRDVPAVSGRLDAILLSHLHHDHLDLASLRRLDPEAPLVVPRGTGRTRTVRAARRPLVEVGAGDALTLGGARVTAVPAVHAGRRHPLQRESAPLGYLIDTPARVYFAGDTELFDAMARIARVDVALLPVPAEAGARGGRRS